MIPSIGFIRGAFQVLGASPINLPARANTAANPATNVSARPAPSVTNASRDENTALQNNARRFCTPSPMILESSRLPWTPLLAEHEEAWVRPVLRLAQNISGLDFHALGVSSNEGNPGCRYSEFRYDGTANHDGATVCWQARTRADVSVGVRMNRFGPGIPDEAIIYPHFRVRYVDERNPPTMVLGQRPPLDPSGRTPLPIGPSVLSVPGFCGQLAGIPIPDRETYDPLYPPITPLEQGVSICHDLNSCVWALRYSFNGAIEAFARETQASFIDSFWESLGWDYENFYTLAGLPRDTIDMRLGLFIDRIIRPLITQESRDYLASHHRTWTPNLISLLGPDFQGINLDFQNRPDTYTFPNCSQLTLHAAQPVQNFIRQIRHNPSALFPESAAADPNLATIRPADAQAFFAGLAEAYQNPSELNQIHLESRDDPNALRELSNRQRLEGIGSESGPIRGHRLESQLQIHAPALSFDSPNFGFSRFLARQIEVTGPSLSHIIHNLASGNWNDTTPIRIQLDHPYFSNLSMDFGNFSMSLPQVWADHLEITLPSLSELGQILDIDPDTELSLSLFGRLLGKHHEEILNRIRVNAQGLKIAGHFTVDYQENESHLEGDGAQVEQLLLESLIPSGSASNIPPHPEIPAQAFHSELEELGHLRSMIPDYQNRSNPQRPIPLLYISDARFHHVSSAYQTLGALVAVGTRIQNFRAYFPLKQLAFSSGLISNEGRFSYQGIPADLEHVRYYNSPRSLHPSIHTRLRPNPVPHPHPFFSDHLFQGEEGLNLNPLPFVRPLSVYDSALTSLRLLLDPAQALQNSLLQMLHLQHNDFNLGPNSQVEDLRLTFDLRTEEVAFARLRRTRLSGSVEPGSIVYPSENIRVGFGPGTFINGVQIDADIQYGRGENGAMPKQFEFTYFGNMSLNLNNFVYGLEDHSPYLRISEVRGGSQNACIRANNRQISIVNHEATDRPCNLENGPLSPPLEMPQILHPPQSDPRRNPIALSVEIARASWGLDVDGFHFEHDGTAHLSAGLRYFLLNNSSDGAITFAIDIQNPTISHLRGIISGVLGDRVYRTLLEAESTVDNSIRADRAYLMLRIPPQGERHSPPPIQELRIENFFGHVSNNQPGRNLRLLHLETPLYLLWSQTGQARYSFYPNLIGTWLQARYPRLPEVELDFRRSR
ncbi:MAG: hypothetical protein HQM15_07860 [Deltaproteobacteria bacterium]|nr:hypothetical protein [Deltaproteobacteria bacterium]